MTEAQAGGLVVVDRDIFPKAMGHEHETGHTVSSITGEMTENRQIANTFQIYIPDTVDGYNGGGHAGQNPVSFLLNGSKVYKGGTNLVEVTTPECSSPLDLVRYRRAAELLWHDIMRGYAEELSLRRPGMEVQVRSQYRVIDGDRSRKASHLSIGLDNLDTYPVATEYVLDHMAARSFVTGAGYAAARGMRYAQKVGGLRYELGYAMHGTMYRWAPDDGTTRFEDRCGDLNISDWAVWQHAGSLALALIVARVPGLREQLPVMPRAGDHTELAKHLNPLQLTEDGQVRPNAYGFAAVDFEQSLAEIVMDKLLYYVDEVPTMYYDVASALYKYCEDYRAVVKGEKDSAILADRADWAMKLQGILRNRHRDEAFGIQRSLGDFEMQATDLRYDFKLVKARDGEIIEERQGFGFRSRDKGALVQLVRPIDIERAYRHPPSDTRAAIRGDLLRKYEVTVCDWKRMRVGDSERPGKCIVEMPDVTTTELSPEIREQLSTFKQKI